MLVMKLIMMLGDCVEGCTPDKGGQTLVVMELDGGLSWAPTGTKDSAEPHKIASSDFLKWSVFAISY